MPDHYRTLGVHPSASSDHIHTVYRELARRLHPDRHLEASAAETSLAERRMREINEAWRVLQDPARRRRYDADRGGGRRPPPRPPSGPGPGTAVASDDDLVDVGPPDMAAHAARGLPWILLIIVLVGIFVVTAYAGSGGAGDPPAARSAAPVGSCLVVSPGPATSVVPCTAPHTGRVTARVATPEECPAGTDPRRLASDRLVDCLSDP